MTDLGTTPILSLPFQRYQAQTFLLDAEFTFTLVNADDAQLDLYHYVMYGNAQIPVTIFGIDTTKHCGPLSNIDLAHFVWENFVRFSYKKYAMALSPRGSTLPKLVFVKHYRVESDAWKDKANCDACVESHQDMLLPFHACDLSDDCKCTICTRQSPSLAACAQHVLFNFTLHLGRFQLDVSTTHDRYVYAVRSNRVPQVNLLPPEAPLISVWFCYDIDSPFRFHRDCQGAGPWISRSERLNDPASSDNTINDLIRHTKSFLVSPL
jgi:hypothetical protein